MVAYTYKMPAGIVGNISRMEHATIEQRVLDSTNTPAAPGLPVKVVSGKIQGITTGDVGTAVQGFLVRSYPGQSATNTFGSVTPTAGGLASLLRRGYLDVIVNAGTAAYGSTVYMRVGGAVTGKPLGGIEAVVDGTTASNTLAIPGAYFMGAADANGIAEVAYNI